MPAMGRLLVKVVIAGQPAPTETKQPMSTRPETLDFLLDQIGALPAVRTRRMFGEYCVYLHEKPTAFVCDDQLFVKITDAGRAVLGQPVLGAPYHWVQTPHYLISADRWDDRDALHAAVMATAGALPCPKPRKPKATAR